MPRLQLESATDSFDLDEVLKSGRGVQALTGATGFGLAPKQVQWLEGAGDGAAYRGRRVLPRDIDLPLLIEGTDREDLKGLLSRLARVLSDECTLRFFEDDGTSWSANVVHVGGGDYVYGQDTIGERDLFTVITLRAGDPYFTFSNPTRKEIKNSTVRRSLIGKLSKLQLSNSQAIGSIELRNLGDTNAFPVWKIYGPGNTFRAVSPTGEVLQWNGTLLAGQTLTIDVRAGTVVDNTGANRYNELASAPRLWLVPPGTSTAECSLQDVTFASSITCTWSPRKWMVV